MSQELSTTLQVLALDLANPKYKRTKADIQAITAAATALEAPVSSVPDAVRTEIAQVVAELDEALRLRIGAVDSQSKVDEVHTRIQRAMLSATARLRMLLPS